MYSKTQSNIKDINDANNILQYMLNNNKNGIIEGKKSHIARQAGVERGRSFSPGLAFKHLESEGKITEIEKGGVGGSHKLFKWKVNDDTKIENNEIETIKKTIYQTMKDNIKKGIFEISKGALTKITQIYYPTDNLDEAIEQLKNEGKITQEIKDYTIIFKCILNEIKDSLPEMINNNTNMLDEKYTELCKDLCDEDVKNIEYIVSSISSFNSVYQIQKDTIKEISQKLNNEKSKNNVLESLISNYKKVIQYLKYDICKADR